MTSNSVGCCKRFAVLLLRPFQLACRVPDPALSRKVQASRAWLPSKLANRQRKSVCAKCSSSRKMVTFSTPRAGENRSVGICSKVRALAVAHLPDGGRGRISKLAREIEFTCRWCWDLSAVFSFFCHRHRRQALVQVELQPSGNEDLRCIRKLTSQLLPRRLSSSCTLEQQPRFLVVPEAFDLLQFSLIFWSLGGAARGLFFLHMTMKFPWRVGPHQNT